MTLALPETVHVTVNDTSTVEWSLDFSTLDSTATKTFQRLLDANLLDGVLSSAAAFLWRWSGRRFGLIRNTVHLCLDGQTCTPHIRTVTSVQAGCCPSTCTCHKDCTLLRLPGRIDRVHEVRIDDESVQLDRFRIVNDKWLQFDQCWPRCSEADLVVDYTRGLKLDSHGQLATAMLAVEMGKAVLRDQTCGLPQRVQTITRQGVTIGMLDDMQGLEDGKTGIWLVDSWLASVTRIPSGGKVYSIDRPRPNGTRFIRKAAGDAPAETP